MWSLFLTTVLPEGGRGGGEIVSQRIIEALRESVGEVRVLGYRRTDDAAGHAGEICVGRRPVETASAGSWPLVWMALSVVRNEPYSVAKYRSGSYLHAVRQAVQDGPALVVLDHAQTHFLAPAIPAALPCVFVAHNAEHRLYADLSRSSRSPSGRWAHRRESRLIADAELDLLKRARQTWCLTEEDRDVLGALAESADVRVLQPPGAVRGPLDPPRSADPARDIALIGSWSWDANRRGLRWFADEVAPCLSSELRVEVAGTGAEWLDGRHPHVIVRGRVESAEAFLREAGVIAVPARAGGGVQVKTLDAIATGRPVVATERAVRGLHPLPPSVTVADEPAQFADALVRQARRAGPADLSALEWSRAREEKFRRRVAEWSAEAVGSSGPLPRPPSRLELGH